MKKQNDKTKILVIDDDPVFRALITKAGKECGIAVTSASSLREVSPMAVPKLFDVVLLDYYLDDMKENLTGTDIAFALESTPIILMSSSDHVVNENDPWPTSIRKFVSKKKGVHSILQEAQKFVEVQ